jgi:hypothetical protein
MGSGAETTARQRSTPPFISISLTEWHAIINSRANLLLVGSESATRATLTAIKPYLVRPHWRCKAKNGLSLPLQKGTLILYGVAALGSEQQALFFRWLEEAPERIQVVSVTDTPIFPLVEQGTFLADLYYRLNVMQIELPLA